MPEPELHPLLMSPIGPTVLEKKTRFGALSLRGTSLIDDAERLGTSPGSERTSQFGPLSPLGTSLRDDSERPGTAVFDRNSTPLPPF